MFKFLLCFIIITLSNKALAIISKEIVDFIEFKNNQLKIEYKNLDHRFVNIDQENRPYVTCKNECLDDEVSYFLHGYMGSPFEMKYIADSAYQKGHTIFNDLIFGYGSFPEITNIVKKEMYVKNVEITLDFLFKHYNKVNLTGFSTGGLLISNYLDDHPQYLSKVGKVQLISPFFYSHFNITPTIGKLLRGVLPLINVDRFYRYTSYPDVEVITMERRNYLQEIPVYAATEIADLAEYFTQKAHVISELKNIEIYLTKNDEVLSYDKSLPFLKQTYPFGKFYLYEGPRKPHHLMSPIVSNVAIEIKNNF